MNYIKIADTRVMMAIFSPVMAFCARNDFAMIQGRFLQVKTIMQETNNEYQTANRIHLHPEVIPCGSPQPDGLAEFNEKISNEPASCQTMFVQSL